MIRTTAFEVRQRQERLDAKTLDNLFRRRIEEGAKCSPFVSQAILQIVKEVFALQAEHVGKQLDLGQVKLLVPAAHERATLVMLKRANVNRGADKGVTTVGVGGRIAQVEHWLAVARFSRRAPFTPAGSH